MKSNGQNGATAPARAQALSRGNPPSRVRLFAILCSWRKIKAPFVSRRRKGLPFAVPLRFGIARKCDMPLSSVVTGATVPAYCFVQPGDSWATFGKLRCEGLAADGPSSLSACARLLLPFLVFEIILPRSVLGVNRSLLLHCNCCRKYSITRVRIPSNPTTGFQPISWLILPMAGTRRRISSKPAS